MPLCILYHKGHCSTAHSYAQMSFVPKLRKAYSIILDANSTLEGPPLARLGVLSVWMSTRCALLE